MSTPVYPDRVERATLADLVRELLGKFNDLLNTQVRLVKTEIKVESRKLALAVAFGVAALVIGFLALFFLGVSLILLLAKLVGDFAWASALTTAIFLAVAGLCAFLMMKEIRKNSAKVDVDM